MRLSLLLLAAPAVVLAGCATTQTSLVEAPPPAADTAYGMFLAGSAALSEGRNADAAHFLERARVHGGDDPALAERAFTAALMAGDVEKAAELSPQGAEASEPIKRLGRLVRTVALLKAGKGKLAQTELGEDGIGFPHRIGRRRQGRGGPTPDAGRRFGRLFRTDRSGPPVRASPPVR
jgi:hypothetical protein